MERGGRERGGWRKRERRGGRERGGWRDEWRGEEEREEGRGREWKQERGWTVSLSHLQNRFKRY